MLTPSERRLEIAIIGGGIAGLVSGIGLIKRDFSVTIFEQSQGFREIGAGIAFTANVIRCMALIDDKIVQALRAGGANATSASLPTTENSVHQRPARVHDFLRWVDGYNDIDDIPAEYREEGEATDRKLLYKIDAGYRGFEGTRRDTFLEQLAARLPEEAVQFHKKLSMLHERQDGRVVMTFQDGSIAEADAVLGCDGIKSKVRQLIYGPQNPASYPHYSHRIAYRGLVNMQDAIDALGEYRARNQHMHVGPNAHVVHYPVANGTMINVATFVHDKTELLDVESAVTTATRSEAEDVFKMWCKPIRNLIACYPEQLNKWALFDLWNNPLPRYNEGLLCLIGDAAHASVPHHGAGAVMGIEDVLCLCSLLEEVKSKLVTDFEWSNKAKLLRLAFEVFSKSRKPRTQWLTDSSRRVCDLYQQEKWADKNHYDEAKACFKEIEERSYRIWNFDYETMVDEARNEFLAGIEKGR